MKRKLTLWGVFAVLGLSLVAWCYPRTFHEPSHRAIELPNRIGAWLEAKESAVAGLREGVKKEVLWAGSPETITELSIAYLHGFSASRREISPVVESIAKRLHANAFMTRLHGHGSTGEMLAKASAEDWIEDAREAIAVARAIGKKVVLIGTSMGAILSLFAAFENPDLEAVVLISPIFAPKDPRAMWLLSPGGQWLAELVNGPIRKWTPTNLLQVQGWTTEYPVMAVVPVMQLVKRAQSFPLEQLRPKVLGFYTPLDGTVDSDLILKKFDEIGSSKKQLLRFDDAQEHVLVGDAMNPKANERVVEAVIDFLK